MYRPTIVYDADCEACKLNVCRVLTATYGAFDWAPWQDPEVRAKWYLEGSVDDGIRVVDNGRIYVAMDAVHQIARRMPRWQWVAWLYYIPGLRQLARWAYRLAAKRRSCRRQP